MDLCSQLHFPLMMPWMWGLLTVVVIVFYFILVSFLSKSDIPAVPGEGAFESNLCQCAKSGWSQMNCRVRTASIHILYITDWRAAKCWQKPRLVVYFYIWGGTGSCFFFFLSPHFPFTWGCLYFHLQVMLHSSLKEQVHPKKWKFSHHLL